MVRYGNVYPRHILEAMERAKEEAIDPNPDLIIVTIPRIIDEHYVTRDISHLPPLGQGTCEMTIEEARRVLEDAVYYSTLENVEVARPGGTRGMHLTLFNAYRMLANKLRRLIEEKGEEP